MFLSPLWPAPATPAAAAGQASFDPAFTWSGRRQPRLLAASEGAAGASFTWTRPRLFADIDITEIVESWALFRRCGGW
jgi:hypothetical protein